MAVTKQRVLKYIDPETTARLSSMRADYQQGQEEAKEIGRSGWDMAQGFVNWVRSIARWVLLGLAMIAVYFIFGWIALTAMLLGVSAAYVIGTIFLKGRYEVVDAYDDETLQWDTYEVGVEKFRTMKHTGLISPVSSSRGTVRYLATAFDPDAGTMTSAWVTELSSFQYLVDFRTHGRLRKLFEGMLDEFLDHIGYSSVFGKIKASTHMKAFINDYDASLDSLKPAYTAQPAMTHEIVQTPLDKIKREETTKGTAPGGEPDAAKA